MRVRVAESDDYPRVSPYVRLAMAVIAQSCHDWADGSGDLYQEADRFFFADGPVFAGVKLAKERIDFLENGITVTILPGERYFEEPIAPTRRAIREHWFSQAGLSLPEPVPLRAFLIRFRLRLNA